MNALRRSLELLRLLIELERADPCEALCSAELVYRSCSVSAWKSVRFAAAAGSTESGEGVPPNCGSVVGVCGRLNCTAGLHSVSTIVAVVVVVVDIGR